MVNEIKLDGLSPAFGMKKEKSNIEPVSPAVRQENVEVTNHLQHFVNLSLKEMHADTTENNRLLAVKQAIQTNTYHVDADVLAKKLTHQIFSNLMDV